MEFDCENQRVYSMKNSSRNSFYMDIETVGIIIAGLITMGLALHSNISSKKKEKDLEKRTNELIEAQKQLLSGNDKIITSQAEVNEKSSILLKTQDELIVVQSKLFEVQNQMNKLTVNQNINLRWNSKYEELKTQLTSPVLVHPWDVKKNGYIIPARIFKGIHDRIWEMYGDPEYASDLFDYQSGNKHKSNFYSDKKYIKILNEVHLESYTGVKI
jgi:hypothetical protein